MLGSGGSAKAAYYAVKKLNLACEVYCRNHTKLNKIINKFEISELHSGTRLHKNYDIVINCIPSHVEIDYSLLSDKSLIIEMSYHCQKNNHCQTVNGYEILYRQAYYQYCIWNEELCYEKRSRI